MKISIRYKILGVLGLLLITAIALYTLLASSIFRQEKIALLYDINHSIAVNTAAQLRSTVLQQADRIRVYVITQRLSRPTGVKLPESYLEESHLSDVRLYRKNGGAYEPVSSNPFSLPAEKLGPHFSDVETSGLALWRDISNPDPSQMYLATQIEFRVGSVSEKFIAVARLDAKPIIETLQSANLFLSYLLKPNGDVLVHYEKNKLAAAGQLSNHPLIKTLSESKGVTSGVLSYPYEGNNWYGAYASLGVGNLFFISQAGRDEITTALETLLKRSLLFGIIVVTVTFLASILLSKRLTRNLTLLTQGTRQIGQGDLTTKIDIHSGDEVQELANSFNKMIADLKASRDEIEQYNRELEERVALRTQQLKETNALIKEVQEKLLQSAQLAAAGEVAGRTAHEVLNPLTSILARLEKCKHWVGSPKAASLPAQFTEILNAWESDFKDGGLVKLTSSLQAKSSLRPDLTLFEEDFEILKKLSQIWEQEQREILGDLGFVQTEAQRILRIIDRMREPVRFSSAKEETSCHKALTEAIATLSDYFAKIGIQLKQRLVATNDIVFLNRDEFIQIITNLFRNSSQAISAHEDHAKKQQGIVTIRTFNEGSCLKVEVIDNGIGISADKHELLFEQGFTTKAPSEGTGLGLAICRRYARAFGGEVKLAYSEPGGRGTCFQVVVPLKSTHPLKIAI